jgi:hypothetical protein
MPILDPMRSFLMRPIFLKADRFTGTTVLLAPILLVVLLAATGCKKDVAQEATSSDANGYLCLKCGVKLYTSRSVFIGPACPKCKADTLMEVVGYRCDKDQYVTLRAQRGDALGALVCEKCRADLRNSMFLPREKDLKAWGAAKAAP